MSIAAGQQIEILRAKIYQENFFDPSDEYLYEEIIKSLSWHLRQFKQIDELEAEVERLQLALGGVTESFVAEQLVAERALADGLAEALRVVLTYHTEDAYILQAAALASYEEARNQKQ